MVVGCLPSALAFYVGQDHARRDSKAKHERERVDQQQKAHLFRVLRCRTA